MQFGFQQKSCTQPCQLFVQAKPPWGRLTQHQSLHQQKGPAKLCKPSVKWNLKSATRFQSISLVGNLDPLLLESCQPKIDLPRASFRSGQQWFPKWCLQGVSQQKSLHTPTKLLRRNRQRSCLRSPSPHSCTRQIHTIQECFPKAKARSTSKSAPSPSWVISADRILYVSFLTTLYQVYLISLNVFALDVV